jgi:outer membrane protein assembly factor BamB
MKQLAILILFATTATGLAQNTFHGNNAHSGVTFNPLFGDFEDMYIDFYRFISIGAIVSSPVIDKGAVYFGSMDGNLYALQ